MKWSFYGMDCRTGREMRQKDIDQHNEGGLRAEGGERVAC